jgi:hypothetical protein
MFKKFFDHCQKRASSFYHEISEKLAHVSNKIKVVADLALDGFSV